MEHRDNVKLEALQDMRPVFQYAKAFNKKINKRLVGTVINDQVLYRVYHNGFAIVDKIQTLEEAVVVYNSISINSND